MTLTTWDANLKICGLVWDRWSVPVSIPYCLLETSNLRPNYGKELVFLLHRPPRSSVMLGILVLSVLVLSVVACSGEDKTQENTVATPVNMQTTQTPPSTQFPTPTPLRTPSEKPTPTPTLAPSPTPSTDVPSAPTAAAYGTGRLVGPTSASQPIPIPTPIAASPTPITVSEPTSARTESPTPAVMRVSRSSLTRDKSPEADLSNVTALVGGNTAFAFDLYQAMNDSDGNLFMSPYSISLALAMAYAGARGDTERQMAETLHFDLPQDQLHSAFNALDLSLTGQIWEEEGDGFLLNVASSVWAQDGYGFLPDYLNTLALNYGEEMRPVDFRLDPNAASARINDWVADKTEERITNLISPDAITPFTRLVLANAVYFKAEWQQPFDERATSRQTFHALARTESEVEMMRQQSNLRYAAAAGYQAVELPYKGGEMAMIILLPDTGRFSEFEESLSGDSAHTILDGLDNELVRLTMPKFETESEFSLSDTLKDMGMPDAFDNQSANFSGMDGRLCRARGDVCLLISDVLHKAFISVDEAGTEAAAATAVIVAETQAFVVEPEPIDLIVDRPFLYIIRHQETGAILFLGRMLNP